MLLEMAANRGKEFRLGRGNRGQGDAPAPQSRGFEERLRRQAAPGIIAELKSRSPSQGAIRADLDPAGLARRLESSGAAALSVITDAKYFGGSLEWLSAAREACSLPVLRKDFIVDPHQIDEAKAAGSDAVLLIARLHQEPGTPPLEELHRRARELEMDALVEVRTEREMAEAARIGATLIGVNARNLEDVRQAPDLSIFERLAPLAPPEALLVAASGLHSGADIHRMAHAGAGAFLIGGEIMQAREPGLRLAELIAETQALCC